MFQLFFQISPLLPQNFLGMNIPKNWNFLLKKWSLQMGNWKYLPVLWVKVDIFQFNRFFKKKVIFRIHIVLSTFTYSAKLFVCYSIIRFGKRNPNVKNYEFNEKYILLLVKQLWPVSFPTRKILIC